MNIDQPFQWYGGQSFAQHGDDYAILNIFKRFGIERPSYLDIGAHHPWEVSNTALLYKRGSRGINVEANAEVIPLFEQERPDDLTIWAAVLHPRNINPKSAYTTLYRINETSGINTTVVDGLKSHGGHRDSVVVPAKSIQEIVDIHRKGQYPDLLSIDAEGRDLEIIESIDWHSHYLPKVICVEATSPSGDQAPALRYLMNNVGYYVHSWCGFNMLFCPITLKHMLH
jgi:FkbM family methyltransferase